MLETDKGGVYTNPPGEKIIRKREREKENVGMNCMT